MHLVRVQGTRGTKHCLLICFVIHSPVVLCLQISNYVSCGRKLGIELLRSAGNDWLFNELLAIFKSHCKTGIIHAKKSALFLEVDSLG